MDQAALDYLGRLAGLGMSFVGFATIVVTLRRTLGGELTPFDHLLVRYYIESGLLTTVAALVPALLGLFAIPPTVMWRIVSVLAGVLGPIYFELYFHWRRRITQGQLYGRRIRIAVSVAVFVGLWVNAIGIFFPPNGALYALALTWFLIQAGIVFMQTLEGVLRGKPPAQP